MSVHNSSDDFAERERRQESVSAWLDLPLSVLALVVLALIIVEFTVDLSATWVARISAIQIAIWIVFLVAFAAELWLAPSKVRFLKRNWLAALALAVPMLRVLRLARAFRVLRGARALRSLNLVRAGTALNRAWGEITAFLRMSRLLYVGVLAALLILTGAASAYYLERGEERSTISTYGDAMWWAATTVLEIASPLEAVTAEGRALAVFLRLLGVALIGYLTAAIAAHLIGGAEQPGEASLRQEIRALRADIAQLRRSGGRAADAQPR